jgi:hypothetical protein
MIKLMEILRSNSKAIPPFLEVWNNVILKGLNKDLNTKEITKLKREASTEYFRLLKFYKNLRGKFCYRTMCVPRNTDPTTIPRLGIYWSLDPNIWITFCTPNEGTYPIKICYKAVVDLKKVNWKETIYANMDSWLSEVTEQEIRFLNGSNIFVDSVLVVDLDRNEQKFGFNMEKFKGQTTSIQGYRKV